MDVAGAIADPVRRDILSLLRHGPLPAGDIAARFAISRPAVSRHLRVLRESGLVVDRPDGRRRVYHLDVGPLAEIDAWLAQFRAGWAPVLDALETEVHRTKRDRRQAAHTDTDTDTDRREDRMTTPTPTPTGALRPGPDGRDLVLTRTFRAPIEDVWASITEPERTARWFATWSGEAGPGRTIRYRLTHEGDDAPEADMLIEACEAPLHLVVSTVDEHGTWRLEARLTEDAGTTVLTFVHHRIADTDVGSVGPGWEYYLDMLVASRSGGPLPSFDDYYPAQKAYYEAQG